MVISIAVNWKIIKAAFLSCKSWINKVTVSCSIDVWNTAAMLTLQSPPCNFLSLYWCTNSSITQKLQDSLLKQHNLLIVEPIEKNQISIKWSWWQLLSMWNSLENQVSKFHLDGPYPAICSLLQVQAFKKVTNMIMKARMVLNLNQKLQDGQETQISLTVVQIGY